jgi:HSP20 family protein
MVNVNRGQLAPTSGRSSQWDPLRAMQEMLRWDPMHEIAGGRGVQQRGEFEARFDVVANPDGYVFRADVPGVKESDVDVTLQGNRLTISGKREYEQKEERGDWFLSERGYGSFTRAFTLPDDVSPEQIHAELKDGVLLVHVPRKQEAQPRKIELKKEAKVQ